MEGVFIQNVDVSKNAEYMAIVINELIMEYKNNTRFLKRIIKEAKPSILSIYNTTIKLANQDKYKPKKHNQNNTELCFMDNWNGGV